MFFKLIIFLKNVFHFFNLYSYFFTTNGAFANVPFYSFCTWIIIEWCILNLHHRRFFIGATSDAPPCITCEYCIQNSDITVWNSQHYLLALDQFLHDDSWLELTVEAGNFHTTMYSAPTTHNVIQKLKNWFTSKLGGNWRIFVIAFGEIHHHGRRASHFDGDDWWKIRRSCEQYTRSHF